jgi:hypothetical protein
MFTDYCGSTDTMKIELKNIKYASFASHETNCYSASIYVDGKKAGTVDNQGYGGADNIHWNDSVFGQSVEDWAASQPKIKTEYGEMTYDLELLFGQLVDQWLLSKELTRNLKKGLLVRDSDTKAGSWRIFTSKLSQTIPEAMLGNLIRTGKVRADAICLNTLPIGEALKLWGAV